MPTSSGLVITRPKDACRPAAEIRYLRQFALTGLVTAFVLFLTLPDNTVANVAPPMSRDRGHCAAGRSALALACLAVRP